MLVMLDRDDNAMVDAADLKAIFAEIDQDGDGTIETTEFGHGHFHRGPRR